MKRRILSGAMHYFRVLPQQWPHRFAMLKAMGLNTVETYVPWNLHEPSPSRFRFDGLGDLQGYLLAAAEAGLDAIVRPGPFICAEWDNGGLPPWLTGHPGIQLRCMDPEFLSAVDDWFDELIPRIAAHQKTKGGNVISVQVENEYGSYGSDKTYLHYLAKGLRRRGIDVPLFTSDGPQDAMLAAGTLPGIPATVNFGRNPEEAFATLRKHRPDDELFCMEFWCGWFDHWGNGHIVRDAEETADVLDRILAAGAHVNIYMAHGGTNFGTSAGANQTAPGHVGGYKADTTSYDYDAPIAEDGSPTPKFWAMRKVLAAHSDDALPEPPAAPGRLSPRILRAAESVRLFDALDVLDATPVSTPTPPTFEDLGLTHGLVLYRATLPGPRPPAPLTVGGLADRAHVFAEGKLTATLDADNPTVEIDADDGGRDVEVLVESMGRTNYGPCIGERKGITGLVRHGQQIIHNWTSRPIDLSVASLPWGAGETATYGPMFYRSLLDVAEPGDARVSLPGWTKGYVWINGFCLGRYWAIGPQEALYLPWPLLRAGRNEIVVLELDGTQDPVLELS